MSTKVEAPAPLDPAKVGADTLETQLRLAPDVFAANAQYLPQYANLALQVAGMTTPGLQSIQTAANTQQRTADIADVRNLAGSALEAWRAANPELAGAQDQLARAINAGGAAGVPQVGRYQAGTPTLGPAARAAGSALMPGLEADAAANLGQVSPLQLKLQQQAMEQLGAELSPAELRNVQQSTRAAYASRGLYDSNSALAAEVMNTAQARRARQLENAAFAQSVDASGQAQLAGNRAYAGNVATLGNSLSATNAGADNQFALSRYGTEAGLGQFNAGLSAQIDQTNAQLGLQGRQQHIANLYNLVGQYASTAQDPYQLVLGRSGAPGAGLGLAQSAGPTMFDPFNSSITSIYAGNQANELAARTATANNKAALWAGGMNMVGNIFGG